MTTIDSYAEPLLGGLRAHLPRWALDRAERAGLPAPDTARIDDTMDQLERLLGADIDEQWTGPLDIIRGLLPDLDEELQPASFADVAPELGPLGIAWGAAKAHEHLRRHRPGPSRAAPPSVAVFAPELGDRSRFAPYSVRHVRTVEALRALDDEVDVDLVIVDLDRAGDPTPWRIHDAHVVGFGSHVATDRLAAARGAGFDAVLPRSRFFAAGAIDELLAPVRTSDSGEAAAR